MSNEAWGKWLPWLREKPELGAKEPVTTPNEVVLEESVQVDAEKIQQERMITRAKERLLSLVEKANQLFEERQAPYLVARFIENGDRVVIQIVKLDQQGTAVKVSRTENGKLVLDLRCKVTSENPVIEIHDHELDENRKPQGKGGTYFSEAALLEVVTEIGEAEETVSAYTDFVSLPLSESPQEE